MARRRVRLFVRNAREEFVAACELQLPVRWSMLGQEEKEGRLVVVGYTRDTQEELRRRADQSDNAVLHCGRKRRRHKMKDASAAAREGTAVVVEAEQEEEEADDDDDAAGKMEEGVAREKQASNFANFARYLAERRKKAVAEFTGTDESTRWRACKLYLLPPSGDAQEPTTGSQGQVSVLMTCSGPACGGNATSPAVSTVLSRSTSNSSSSSGTGSSASGAAIRPAPSGAARGSAAGVAAPAGGGGSSGGRGGLLSTLMGKLQSTQAARERLAAGVDEAAALAAGDLHATAKRIQEEEMQFEEDTRKVIGAFAAQTERHEHEFTPCDKPFRQIIHDIVEDYENLVSASVGDDELRHVVVYHKEHAPQDILLDDTKFRRGDVINMALQKPKHRPNDDAVVGAKAEQLFKGFEAVDQIKRDRRSVAEVQEEIRRRKKRQRQEQHPQPVLPSSSSFSSSSGDGGAGDPPPATDP